MERPAASGIGLVASGKRYRRALPACNLTKLDQVYPRSDIPDTMSSDRAAMVTTFNLYDAKTQLSSLVERAAAGEEIVIAKAGRPMARLVPVEECRPKKLREPGLLKGKVWIAEDFDEWPEDILASFEADIEPTEQASSHDQAGGRR